MIYRTPTRASLVLIAALFAAGCEASDRTTLEPTTEPWTVQFTFGSTSINNAEVTTAQTSVTADRITDRVAPAALPDGDLEFFITHVYAPTDRALHTGVDSVTFVATHADGTTTPNFLQGVFYLGRISRDGQLFDLYRLQGLHVEPPALTAETFVRLEIGFTLEHRTPARDPLRTSRKTIVIEKQ